MLYSEDSDFEFEAIAKYIKVKDKRTITNTQGSNYALAVSK